MPQKKKETLQNPAPAFWDFRVRLQWLLVTTLVSAIIFSALIFAVENIIRLKVEHDLLARIPGKISRTAPKEEQEEPSETGEPAEETEPSSEPTKEGEPAEESAETEPTPEDQPAEPSEVASEPYWGMVAHDARLTSRSSYPGPSQGIELKWKYPFSEGRVINMQPTVDRDGTIYVGTWGHAGESDLKKFMAIEYGDRARGKLYAFNTDGSLKWTYDPGPLATPYLGTIETAPLIGKDGKLYIGRGDGILRTVSTATGESPENLHFSVDSNTGSRGQIIWPAIQGPNGFIYFGTQDYLQSLGLGYNFFYAVKDSDSGLTLKWKYPEDSFSDWVGSASADSQGRVFVGSGSRFYAFHADTGELLWQKWLPLLGRINGGVISDDETTVYLESTFAHGHTKLTALFTADGGLKWQFAVDEESVGVALGLDGIVYAATGSTEESDLYIGKLYALADEGKNAVRELWDEPVIFDSSLGVPAVDSNGIIYVKTRGSGMEPGDVEIPARVYAYKDEGDHATELWVYDDLPAGEEIWWGNVVIGSDKTLYFATATCDMSCADEALNPPALYALGEP